MDKYILKNLDCANCALSLEKRLAGLDDVRSVSIDFASLTMEIDTDDMDSVKRAIKKIEPDVEVSKPRSSHDDHDHAEKTRFPAVALMLAILGFLSSIPSFAIPSHISSALFISAFLTAGHPVILKAIRNLAGARLFDENFLMTVSTAGAIIIGELPEAAGVMVFYSIGEYFQSMALNRSRKSVRSLMELRPDTALLLDADGNPSSVPAESVMPGDIILVRPGERIPLDGTVIKGMSYVDGSATTGEHKPVKVSEGEQVFSGHIVNDSSIIVKVEKRLAESSISRIMELVENASLKKARTERFITRFSKYYTPAVVFSALFIAFIPPLFIPGASLDEWVYRALVMLVISCPCALVISIPLGYFGGIGASSASGILIKGSDILDRLTRLKTIVFDKTGTLTKGEFKVKDIVPRNGFTSGQLLDYAARAEADSRHPIALSIRAHAGIHKAAAAAGHKAFPGMGIQSDVSGKTVLVGNDKLLHLKDIEHDTCEIGGTVAHVAVNGIYAGFITVGDTIRDKAAAMVEELRRSAITDMVMLTGDSHYPAQEIAAAAGIGRFHSSLSPAEKVERLEEIMAESPGFTAFAGDGINDAPVLMRSDIGISMGATGTDAAIETSDIVLIDDDLSLIPKALKIAHKTKNIIRENIIFALSVKLFFLASGALGEATMWEAVFADIGVALIAVFNSMRIQHVKRS